MKINQVEQAVGITRKNIRFYEEQGLLHPLRNPVNGYRDYSDEDVSLLLKIRLLRRLSIPIGEIRQLQENRLSFTDCMQRHIVCLDQEKHNLSLIQEMCGELCSENTEFDSLPAADYLEKMQQLEKGGTRFMDIVKEDQRKRKYGALTGAAIMILVMAFMIAMFVWEHTIEPIPVGIFLFFLAIPVIVIICIIVALYQRFREIEGGEEHEAVKY